MLGSDVEVSVPMPYVPLMACSELATFEFNLDGRPPAPATCNRLMVCSAPLASLYENNPCCAAGLSTTAVRFPEKGWMDSAQVPKKNNLFLRIGPPTLAPKSFNFEIFMGWLRALLIQELALRTWLRKSSYTRP